jgi:predicted nucleotidyltransferase
MDTNEVKKKIAPVLRKYNVIAASVFASVARGEANEKSDVDLLVKIGQLPFGIWGFVALKQDIEKALQKKWMSFQKEL